MFVIRYSSCNANSKIWMEDLQLDFIENKYKRLDCKNKKSYIRLVNKLLSDENTIIILRII